MSRTAVFALPLAAGAAILALAAQPASSAGAGPNGAALYGRCAACHTANGKGVPGAFPPLGVDFRKLAAKPAGRRYLVLAVTRGVSGPLTVEGKLYRGVMPAQAGMDDSAVAAVLNHVGTKIATQGPAFKPFTPAEVGTARASGARLTGGDVARLHAAAGGG